MTPRPDPSLTLRLRIDAACDRFEAAWQSGPRPDPKDFVSEAPEPERSSLLLALIAVDAEYRRHAGEQPTAADYRTRFPHLDPAQLDLAIGDNARTRSGSTQVHKATPSTVEGPWNRPITSVPPIHPDAPPGYELLHVIGRGGMGDVYRARDLHLSRDVAVKLLQERYEGDAEAAARFLEEARITGQLQHPGIPPIHQVGTLPDGRPFLAMKLIKGQTLAELLASRGASAAGSNDDSVLRRDPRSLTRHGSPEMLPIFEHICQAVAYAHAHDVIHRDLKPQNVMVGAFGEVQVMDWGLAKVLANDRESAAAGDAAQTAATAIRTNRGASDHTQAGSILGTPAFMPPEQAIGAVNQIDRRSDVFGLGAILAVILTGKPPFIGENAESTRQLAARGKVDDCFARLDGCGADPELVALCKRCLAPESADRPADAGVVARAVSELRAQAEARARHAELERVRVEGEKAAADLQAAEQRKRRRVQLALAAAMLVIVAGSAGFAWWADRKASEKQSAELRQQLRDEQIANEQQMRVSNNRAALAVWIELCEKALAADDVGTAATALAEIDRRLPDGGGEEFTERIARSRDDAGLLRELNRVDLFRWTPQEQQFPEPLAVAARWRSAFVGSGWTLTVPAAAESARRIGASMLRMRLIATFNSWLVADPQDDVRTVLRAVDPHPYREMIRDAMLSRDEERVRELANQPEALTQPAEFTVALGQHPAVPRVRRRALLESAAHTHPENLNLLMELGKAYTNANREESAQRLRWFQAAVAAHPRSVAARNNLGIALAERGEALAAIATWKETVRLDPNYSHGHHNLGVALYHYGQIDAALVALREADRLQPNTHGTLAYLGHTLIAKGDYDGAIAAFQSCTRLQPTAAVYHFHLGHSLQLKRDWAAAAAAYREAVRLDPMNARAFNNLGVVLMNAGQLDDAIVAFKDAIRLDPKSVRAHYELGVALQNNRNLAAAVAEFRQTIRLDPKFAAAHNSLGVVLKDQGDREGAIAAFRNAVRCDPKFVAAHYNLGTALTDNGEFQEAAAAFREAVRLDPNFAAAHAALGAALAAAGDLDGAIASYEAAVRLSPKTEGFRLDLDRVRKLKDERELRQPVAPPPREVKR